MKTKTVRIADLTGAALDWVVATALGIDFDQNGWNPVNVFLGARVGGHHRYSENHNEGGEIMTREGISTVRLNDLYFPKGNEKGEHWEPYWCASKVFRQSEGITIKCYGPTPLIAGMRCYAVFKLGGTIEIPEVLWP